jgi:hypothetical protein
MILKEIWGVWVGFTGNRTAWLKDNDGLRAGFATREEAEAEAKRLTDRIGSNPDRKAEFYTARPFALVTADRPQNRNVYL